MIAAALESVLAAVIAEPDDDLHRLVYADLLEERGGPGDCDRAEFVRYAVRNPTRSFACEGDGDIGLFCGDDCGLCQTCHEVSAMGVPEGLLGEDRYAVRRGFLDEVRCTTRLWQLHGRRLAREHPIREVRLTGRVVVRDPLRGEGQWCVLTKATWLASRLPRLWGYDSEAGAHAAVSAACIAWAKSARCRKRRKSAPLPPPAPPA